ARSVSRACCSATSRLSSWARRRGSGMARRFFLMPLTLVLINSHPVSLRCILFHFTIAPLLQASPSVAIVPLQHGGHDEFREGGAIEKEKEAVKTSLPGTSGSTRQRQRGRLRDWSPES